MFDRFYRPASQESEGTGLGLSIAKAAADRNGITIAVANRGDGTGLVTSVRMPNLERVLRRRSQRPLVMNPETNDIGSMNHILSSWIFWAGLSATFAALTAIFAKIGIENVNSDFATLIRTVVILGAAGLFVYATGHWQDPSQVTRKTWVFLILSGLATGASWICYFRALKLGDASRVASIDKLSVVLVSIFAVVVLKDSLSLPNWLGVVLIACGGVLVAYRG